jgi:xylulokinase
VCTLNATKVTDAFARLLGTDHAGLDVLAAGAEPGAAGVVLVPYLDGERTPDLPDATGTLAGLRGDVTREQVARAAYEGVVCGLLDGLDALRAAGVDVDGGRLLLVGGGRRSPVYRQVVADLAQRALTVPESGELVALGACVQAAARLSGVAIADVQAAWGLGTGAEVEPSITEDHATAIRTAYAASAHPATGV